jgi:hypothetical protein
MAMISERVLHSIEGYTLATHDAAQAKPKD